MHATGRRFLWPRLQRVHAVDTLSKIVHSGSNHASFDTSLHKIPQHRGIVAHNESTWHGMASHKAPLEGRQMPRDMFRVALVIICLLVLVLLLLGSSARSER